jgi:formylglycine-generating enzyme required for sulfatase activity
VLAMNRRPVRDRQDLRIILVLVCGFTASGHALVQAQAAPGAAGSMFRDCRACPEMVVIPAGSFTMGSSARKNPGPQVTVAV